LDNANTPILELQFHGCVAVAYAKNNDDLSVIQCDGLASHMDDNILSTDYPTLRRTIVILLLRNKMTTHQHRRKSRVGYQYWKTDFQWNRSMSFR
jgi:hypothetical protein